MNERIKELYDQCWFGGFGDDIAVYQKDLIINESIGYCFDSQKFAELIVRECHALVDYENKQFIKAQFKEHFGVEE
jgi:hypothetical protein